MLVQETRLVNLQEPPSIEGYYWVGSNRETRGRENPSGEVGILRASYLEEEWTERGTDWIAQAVKKGGKRWVFTCIYVAHTSERNNKTLYSDISNLFRARCERTDFVLIAGDMNGHIRRFDGKSNFRGELLDKFARENEMAILDGSAKCRGRFTRKKDLVIDYVLVNSTAFEATESMVIDEDRQITTISDHNIIREGVTWNTIPSETTDRKDTS